MIMIVSNTAVLGSFSTLQKFGRQGFNQGIFATVASLARIILPIISELFEQYLKINTSSSLALVMISCSSILLLIGYIPTSILTNRNPNIPTGTPTGQHAILDNKYIRDVLLVISSIFFCIGYYTMFITSFDPV